MNTAFILDNLAMIEEKLVLQCQILILWQAVLDLLVHMVQIDLLR